MSRLSISYIVHSSRHRRNKKRSICLLQRLECSGIAQSTLATVITARESIRRSHWVNFHMMARSLAQIMFSTVLHRYMVQTELPEALLRLNICEVTFFRFSPPVAHGPSLNSHLTMLLPLFLLLLRGIVGMLGDPTTREKGWPSLSAGPSVRDSTSVKFVTADYIRNRKLVSLSS